MPTKFESLVSVLEEQGMTTSDAQGAAEVQLAQMHGFGSLIALRAAWEFLEANCLGQGALQKKVYDAILKAEGSDRA